MRWLVRRFARTVTIDASPERFVFECDGNRVTLEARVWLVGDRIEGVGAEGPPGSEAVELFGDRPRTPAAADRFDLLSKFLHHGVLRALDRRVFVNPILRFEGLSSFDERLGGYQWALFERAVGGLPASELRFADRATAPDV